MTVAYAAARAVGSIPLMPGGLLVVEAVLVPGLVSSGMTLASAISAMLIYRLISWIFIAAIGWVVFFFMFRTEKDIDPDATVDDDAAAPHATRPRTRHEPPTRSVASAVMPSDRRTVRRALAVAALTVVRARRRRDSPRRRRRHRRRRRARRARHPSPSRWSHPVLASVIAAPVPVPATDGKIHLAYELQLTNVLAQDVTLTSVTVLAATIRPC